MVGGTGNRYRVHFPDGSSDSGSFLGEPLRFNDVIPIGDKRWRVVNTRAVTDDENVDYEIWVVPPDE